MPLPQWILRAGFPGLMLALAGCSTGVAVEAARARPPNLVLIVGDDHAYPDYGFMGSTVARTPSLDRLAREGTVFRYGFSTASICKPALRTLLTGLEPLEYAVREVALRERVDAVTGGSIRYFDTLPRRLAQRGYASFQAGKYFEGRYAWAGFGEGMTRSFAEAWRARIGRETMQPVFDFLDAHAREPFFLFFAPMLPHLPFDAPRRYVDLYAGVDLPPETRGYYANVSRFDAVVGQLLARLDRLGLRERTLVVYLADNGWQARGYDAAGLRRDGPRGKDSLYELGLRTPMLFRWPEQVPAGATRDALVSLVDVVPTLLDYAGASPLAGRSGHSLRPLIEGRAEALRSAVVVQAPRIRPAMGTDPAPGREQRVRGGFAVRTARWAFLDYAARPDELYDMSSDPDQSSDVSGARPDVVQRLGRVGRARVAAMRVVPADWPPELPSPAP